MRTYIFLAESLGSEDEEAAEDVVSVSEPAPQIDEILDELDEIARRLLAHGADEGGDFGMGVETGMQRAAEMIEALTKRYREKDEDGQEDE